MENIKVKVSLKELLDSNYWEEYCKKYGVNVYCINEGLADSETLVEIDFEDAQSWLIK